MDKNKRSISDLPSENFYVFSEDHPANEKNTGSNIDESRIKAQLETARNERKLGFTRELIKGLIRLVEQQQSFATELGLSMIDVFPHSYQSLQGKQIDRFIMSLFRSDWQSLPELTALLSDIYLYQSALLQTFDGIAVETLYHMDEEDLVKRYGRLDESCKWRMHKQRVQSLLSDSKQRFESIVTCGLREHYTRNIHEEVRRKQREGNKHEAVTDYIG